VRENGGQYTHAAVWAAWAAAELGDRNTAMRWFEWLNPLRRALSEEQMQQYRLEPYVTAGDIYGAGELTGRGGWSWYSGSAAWLYRFAIRRLLGLQRQGNRLYIRPCVADSWPSFNATLHQRDAEIELRIHAPADIRKDQLFMLKDAVAVNGSFVPLEASGRHVFEIFASDAARQNWLLDQTRSSAAF